MKYLILGMMCVVLLFYSQLGDAYVDCSTPSCPVGYFANSTTCEGSTCITQCLSNECTMQWTQVYSNSFGWSSSTAAQDKLNSGSYQTTNTSLCYQFTYDGAPAADTFIRMFVNTPTTPDCDTHGIGGFFQGTGITGDSNPWFNGMANVSGDVAGGNNEYDYLLRVVRGDSETGSLSGNYKVEMSGDGSIYCVPNSSISCSVLGGTNTCDYDCYNQYTEAYVTQGYYEDQGGSPDNTLYGDQECVGDVTDNRMQNVQFFVYSSPTALSNITISTSCDRTNEAPSVNGVIVKPFTPNAGQDLECTFNYTDPENFLEQNSTFEWWKNGANQNINSNILDKGNLTIGDSWYCKMTPSDGLLFGNKTQSQNNVNITTTVKDPEFKIGNLVIWSKNGYYGHKEEVLNFNQQLIDALSICVPDQSSFCDINLSFSTTSTGILELTNLEVFYALPIDLIFNLTNLTSSFSNTLIEFQIVNNNLPSGNFSWSVNFGDGTTINSTANTFLNASEDTFVLSQYAYASAGTYNITAIAMTGGNSDSEILTVKVT